MPAPVMKATFTGAGFLIPQEETFMLGAGFYNMDCMDALKDYPDGYFDLAIVDPPYGSGNAGGGMTDLHPPDDSTGTGRRYNRFGNPGSIFEKYKRRADEWSADGKAATTENGPDEEHRKWIDRRGGAWAGKYGKKIIGWDTAPGEDYFRELFRISKNQIIWGGNYFCLPPTRCFLVWRKLTISESFSMAMCEYAWTSFNENAKIFECAPQGTASEQRFHPTQKPVKLYSWILSRYAKEGDRILDTHVGSASSLIACHRAGLEYTGFEVDPEYFRSASARLDIEKNQVTMFDVMNGV